MKYFYLFSFLCAFYPLCAYASDSSSIDNTLSRNDGYTWKYLKENNDHLPYVWGYREGYMTMVSIVSQKTTVPNKITFPKNATVGQIAEGIDAVYDDFRNKNIKVNLVFLYVIEALNGVPDDELDEMLNTFRKEANNN